MKLLYNPSVPGKVLFPEFIWQCRNNKVLLTFDDGPNPGSTEIILKVLEELGIKALFFMVGNNIRRYPALANDMLNAGHDLGNHTFNHKNAAFVSKKVFDNEILMFNKVTNEVLNRQTSYFRPPRGRFDLGLQKRLKNYGLKNVMWSLLSFDYKNDINIVKFALDNFLLDNSLVVFHDSDKSKNIIEDSIKYLADKVIDRGFEFGAPLECLN